MLQGKLHLEELQNLQSSSKAYNWVNQILEDLRTQHSILVLDFI
jgi:hypothetical protein